MALTPAWWMTAHLAGALLGAAPAQPTAPSASEAPASAPVTVDSTPGGWEAALNGLPVFVWDRELALNARLGRLATVALLGVGVVALALGGAGVGVTALLQKSPWPAGSDYRERPRSTYVMVSMAVTSFFTILGAACVAGSLFTLGVA